MTGGRLCYYTDQELWAPVLRRQVFGFGGRRRQEVATKNKTGDEFYVLKRTKYYIILECQSLLNVIKFCNLGTINNDQKKCVWWPFMGQAHPEVNGGNKQVIFLFTLRILYNFLVSSSWMRGSPEVKSILHKICPHKRHKKPVKSQS